MEELFIIIEKMLQSKNDYVGTFMDELMENNIYDSKVSEVVVQYLSSALSKPANCREGLVVLNYYMKHASLDVLEQRTNQWTSLVIQALNLNLSEITDLGFTALSLLALNSLCVPEVSKSFVQNNLGNIYESLAMVPRFCALAALKCVEVCLRLYPGPSGPFRKCVEEFLIKLIDVPSQQFGKACGKCMHLLQQVRGGCFNGKSYKESWLNYQQMLIRSLHDVLDLAFANCNEIYKKNPAPSQSCGLPDLILSDEPAKRTSKLFIRFRNLVHFLTIAVRNPYPVAKPVAPKKLLNLIARGLSVTIPILDINPVSENLALGVFLPKMHILLFELLQALITNLGTHLRPYHETILSLAVHELDWTSKKNLYGSKVLGNVRSKVYQVLFLWCSVMHNGSRIEMFAEILLKEILDDTVPYQSECTLKVLSGTRKHKKTRRLLHNTENDKSKIVQSSPHSSLHGGVHFVDDATKKTCISALKTLQKLLVTASSFFKPSQLKVLQIRVIQICSLLYEFPMKQEEIYFNWECRLAVFKVLHTLIKFTHIVCPTPSNIINYIIQNAIMKDRNPIVRKECAELLRLMEIIVHPRKETLLLLVDIREICNKDKLSIKTSQEYVLISEATKNIAYDQCYSDIDGVRRLCDNEIISPSLDMAKQNKKKKKQNQHHIEQIKSTLASEKVANIEKEIANQYKSGFEDINIEFNLQSNVSLQVEEIDSNKGEPCQQTELYNILTDEVNEPFTKKQKFEENEDAKEYSPKNILNKTEFIAESLNEDVILNKNDDIFADIEATFVDELS